MINNVVLVGRMTRDAELRYTPSNQAVATFSLAVNRNFKNQSGEREADFINCVILMRVRLVTQIQWIFQMMIYHSNIIDGQNLKL